MAQSSETIVVNATIEISTAALTAVVENAKRLAGRDEKGYFRVDTADTLGKMVSRFLMEKDFESFAKDPANY